MDNKPSENRQIAAKQFMHSLNELETVLQSDRADVPETATDESCESARAAVPETDEAAIANPPVSQLLDDAVQDIEQFMAEQTPEPE